MAEPHDFAGSTHHFGPPKGEEHRVGWLHVFANKACNVSAWKPTPEELAKLNAGESIFLSVMLGCRPVPTSDGMALMPIVAPVFVGCEAEVKACLIAAGEEVWNG